jgi:hypothetical protein
MRDRTTMLRCDDSSSCVPVFHSILTSHGRPLGSYLSSAYWNAFCSASSCPYFLYRNGMKLFLPWYVRTLNPICPLSLCRPATRHGRRFHVSRCPCLSFRLRARCGIPACPNGLRWATFISQQYPVARGASFQARSFRIRFDEARDALAGQILNAETISP